MMTRAQDIMGNIQSRPYSQQNKLRNKLLRRRRSPTEINNPILSKATSVVSEKVPEETASYPVHNYSYIRNSREPKDVFLFPRGKRCPTVWVQATLGKKLIGNAGFYRNG